MYYKYSAVRHVEGLPILLLPLCIYTDVFQAYGKAHAQVPVSGTYGQPMAISAAAMRSRRSMLVLGSVPKMPWQEDLGLIFAIFPELERGVVADVLIDGEVKQVRSLTA